MKCASLYTHMYHIETLDFHAPTAMVAYLAPMVEWLPFFHLVGRRKVCLSGSKEKMNKSFPICRNRHRMRCVKKHNSRVKYMNKRFNKKWCGDHRRWIYEAQITKTEYALAT